MVIYYFFPLYFKIFGNLLFFPPIKNCLRPRRAFKYMVKWCIYVYMEYTRT